MKGKRKQRGRGQQEMRQKSGRGRMWKGGEEEIKEWDRGEENKGKENNRKMIREEKDKVRIQREEDKGMKTIGGGGK